MIQQFNRSRYACLFKIDHFSLNAPAPIANESPAHHMQTRLGTRS